MSVKIRIAAGVLMLLSVVSIGVFSGIRGLSQYFRDAAKRVSQDEFATLRSSDPELYAARGLTLFEKGDFAGALASFDRAIDLRPYDYMLFNYRGQARFVLGDAIGAQLDYRKSLELAPAYALPNLHLGRFLLNEKRASEAFVYLSRAATLDPGMLPDVLGYAFDTYPGDGSALLRAVAPSDPEAKKQTALFLLKHHQFSAVLDPSIAAGLDEEASRTLVNELIQKGKFQLALTLWKTNLRRSQAVGDPENLVLEGDFESISDLDETFGWQVNHGRDQIAISVGENNGPQGNSRLQIQFMGDSKPDEFVIWQLIVVEPGKRYRLTFDVAVEKLESGGLPVVVVLDASTHNVIAESNSFSESKPAWQSSNIAFSLSEKTEGVILGVQRQPCPSGPCPIFGQIRLDNFSLRKE